MKYRGFRSGAPASSIGSANTITRRDRASGDSLRAAARAVVESLERRQLLAATDPFINEFLADNATGLRDIDGDRNDWIEIHNPGSQPVNLQGWKLQDSSDIWTFPSVSLPANGYLVVFASNKNRAISGQQLHTNFALSKNGEYLALVKPDGEKASEFNPYPEQVEDVSYGPGGMATNVQFMVGTGADAFTHIPSPNSDTLGRTWTGGIENFDHSSWIAGQTGVGYETQPGSTNSYTNLISTDVRAQMFDVNTSAYIRIPFDVENLPNITKLTLRVKYDDGYVAYVNGQHVGTKNLLGSTVNNTSRAATDRNETLVHQFEDLDITQYIGALRNDNNVLAIQGLNRTDTSSDFVIVPELIAESVETGGTASLQYMGQPTPGAVNTTGGAGVVKDTSFSVDRGFYDDPFQLAITTGTSGAEIRYTLDGSRPTPTHGFIYNGPITIGPQLYGTPGGPAKPGVITVRAAAFKPGWNPTNIDAQTYVFLDHVITQDGSNLPNTWGNNNIPDYAMDPRVVTPNLDSIRNDLKSLPTVNLSMPLSDWFGSGGVGIYPSGIGVPKAVSMEYFTADGTESFQIDGGVQIIGGGEGGTSAQRWKTYKLSMRIKFQEIYGDSELAYALFGPDAADEFDTLVFDAQINKTWLHPDAAQRSAAMLIQDQYISDLQNAMSGGAGHGPQGKFVHLYLNGIYWGVYDLHERPDEHFGQEYYGGADEDWDVLSHTAGNANNGGSLATASFADLLDRVRADVTVAANYARVEELLDIDDFIDYMLANFYGGNQDWSHKNWYATHNRVDPEGRWRFHSWDAEHVFHTGFGGTIDPFVDSTGDNDGSSPTEIHQQLTASPEYRMRFADRVQKHFFNGGALTAERATAMYQARMNEVYDAMVAESARWGDNRRPSQPYTREDWLAHQQRLLNEYFPIRSGIVLDQLRARGLYPSTSAPAFSIHGGTFIDPVSVQITRTGTGQIYYTLDGSDPRLPGGSLNPGAQLYTGPINIGQSALLRARVLDGGTWSALTEAPFIIGPPPALRVTEIMYNPAPPAPNTLTPPDEYEFIELQNTGSSPIDVSGFDFRRGITFAFPQGTILQPGQRTVLVKNALAFAERYPGVTIGGAYTGSLANSGDRLILTTHLGQVIQNFEYKDGWHPQTDGDGFSLIAIDPDASNADLSRKDGWRPGQPLHGAPGAADPGPMPGIVVVNEVNTNTVGSADWIEIHNTTASPIDIGGWFLSDDNDDRKKYRIATGTTLPANGYIVFHEATHFGVAGNPGVNTPFALDSFGEAVHLTSADAAGTLLGYRDSVDFGAAPQGVTFGRHVKSTGETDFWPTSEPTPDAANAAPRVGPIVINEIMYNPAAGGDEYIELRNITGSTVDLFDPVNPANTWRFTDGIDFAFPQGASLAAGAYALVVGIDPAAFRTKYAIPQFVQIFGPWTGNLNNAGEKLEVRMPGQPDLTSGKVPYIVVDRVHYESEIPWPITPDGTGPSLARRRSTDYANDVSNWAPSLVNGGTPGASNGDDDNDPPTVDIVDVTPDPRKLGVNSITIVFNEPVTGFDISDLALTRNGGANLLTSQSLASSDGRTWILNGLAGLTGAAGNYELTVKSTGTNIKDAGGNSLVVGATDAWTLDNVAPTVDIVDVTPDPRNAGVDTITITFSESVTGFDLADLSLTRGGGANLLTGAQTLATTDNRTFALGNLGALTGVSGTYTLTLTAAGSGIADPATNALLAGASDSFVVNASSPMTVTGTAGSDTFLVRREGNNLKIYANADGTGTPVADRPFAGVSSVTIDTLAGDDTIILDFAGVDFDIVRFVPSGGFTVNAGDGAADVLRIANPVGVIDIGADAILHYIESITHAGVERHDVPATMPTLDITGPVNVKVNAQGALMTVSRANLAPGAFLDLGDNDLKVLDGNLATIQALVASARNGTSAARWHSPGIGTSAAGNLTGLAVGMQGTDVLVKLTYDGDSNLDGRINADDYFKIDSGFLAQLADPNYADGDFNYDDTINADDYFLIDSAFLGQTGVLAGSGDSSPLAAVATPPAPTAPATSTAVLADTSARSKKARMTPRSESLFSDHRIVRRASRLALRR